MEQVDPAVAQLSAEQPDQEQAGLTRRDFFGLSWRVLTAFAAGQAACLGLRFLASRKVDGNIGEVLTVGLLTDFPLGTITPFDQARFFLLRFEDGGFLALHTRCPHLACVVSWDASRSRFSCPCHGSEFERDGTVINPPAPRPLDRFAVLIEGDRVKIDTRQVIQRTRTEAGDLVYAPQAPEMSLTESARPPAVLPGGHALERD